MTPARSEAGERVIRTVCPLGCGIGCGILAHVKDGRSTRVEPGDSRRQPHLCQRAIRSQAGVSPRQAEIPDETQGREG